MSSGELLAVLCRAINVAFAIARLANSAVCRDYSPRAPQQLKFALKRAGLLIGRMRAFSRPNRDSRTGRDLCCANKGEQMAPRGARGRLVVSSIRNRPTEAQRRDVAVLWLMSAAPMSASAFHAKLMRLPVASHRAPGVTN